MWMPSKNAKHVTDGTQGQGALKKKSCYSVLDLVLG